MNFLLRVWRQDAPDETGRLVDYHLQDVDDRPAPDQFTVSDLGLIP